MKSSHLLIILTVFLLVMGSCKENKDLPKPNSENPVSNLKDKVTTEKVEASTTLKSTDFSGFLDAVEVNLCPEFKDNISDCYTEHITFLKNDLMQKLPYNLIKPYDKPIDWSLYSGSKNFDQLWSSKCGFMNDDDVMVNYYCPNILSTGGEWLDSLATKNALINQFNIEYKKTQDFSDRIQKDMILTGDTNLDFNDPEHRTFYWMYHFSLAEIRKAAEKIKAMSK